MFPIPSLAGDDEEERRSWGGCGCVDVAPTRGIPTNFACANGMDQWIHATDMKGGVAMVARARGGFHHGMDPDKPPAAIFNISSYFSFCGFSLFLGAGSAFADPHPHFRRSHPRPPLRSSQRRRRLGLRPRPDNIDVLYNLRYLRLSSPAFRHPHPRPSTQGIGWRYREPAVPRKPFNGCCGLALRQRPSMGQTGPSDV